MVAAAMSRHIFMMYVLNIDDQYNGYPNHHLVASIPPGCTSKSLARYDRSLALFIHTSGAAVHATEGYTACIQVVTFWYHWAGENRFFSLVVGASSSLIEILALAGVAAPAEMLILGVGTLGNSTFAVLARLRLESLGLCKLCALGLDVLRLSVAQHRLLLQRGAPDVQAACTSCAGVVMAGGVLLMMHSGACARARRTRSDKAVLVLTRLAIPGTPALRTSAGAIELASARTGSAAGGPSLGARGIVVVDGWICGTSRGRGGRVGVGVLVLMTEERHGWLVYFAWLRMVVGEKFKGEDVTPCTLR